MATLFVALLAAFGLVGQQPGARSLLLCLNNDQAPPPHPVSSRKSFIGSTTAATAAGLLLLSSGPAAVAAPPTSAGESIRRSAASLPGLGPTDVFYPGSWAGTWKASRQVTLSSSSAEFVLDYKFRFLPSIEDDLVVADRGFNQAELEAALQRISNNNNAQSSISAVQSCEWTVTNPNDLRLVLADGTRKEIKVTKRSTSLDDGFVSASEFQRVTTQLSTQTVPTIAARRVLTKWKMVQDEAGNNNSKIEGLELVYDMGGNLDPMAMQSVQPSKPTLLSKSRILLERL